MFIYCHLKNRECGFCGESKGVLYCGIAKGDNRIEMIDKCPYKPKKRR